MTGSDGEPDDLWDFIFNDTEEGRDMARAFREAHERGEFYVEAEINRNAEGDE